MARNQFRNVIYLDAPATYDSSTSNPIVAAGVLGRIACILLDADGTSAGVVSFTLMNGQTVAGNNNFLVGLFFPASTADSSQHIMGFGAELGVLHFDNGLCGVLSGTAAKAWIYLN